MFEFCHWLCCWDKRGVYRKAKVVNIAFSRFLLFSRFYVFNVLYISNVFKKN